MNQQPCILVVEDDAAIRLGVVDALTSERYQVREAADGQAGLSAAVEGSFDLVLLDLALPGMDGLAVLAKLREAQPVLPVIIMTARGDEADRVRGLRLGADDYIVKPLGLRELLARVEAVLRRSPQRQPVASKITWPGATFDVALGQVLFEDASRSELSQREGELLTYLAQHRGRVISRNEILRSVWRLDPRGLSTRAIDMQIVRLREKLRDHKDQPGVLLTVRGQGYALGPGVRVEDKP